MKSFQFFPFSGTCVLYLMLTLIQNKKFMQKKRNKFSSHIPFLAHWQRKSDGKKHELPKHIGETSSDLLKLL